MGWGAAVSGRKMLGLFDFLCFPEILVVPTIFAWLIARVTKANAYEGLIGILINWAGWSL